MVATLIEVTRSGDIARLVVDGVEIPPNAIARNSVHVPVDADEIPSVDLTLVGARVSVSNTAGGDA
ncbi:hypothetical protein ACFRH6_17035 [Streptomyces sp. NPDC056749]|uniref:hypothetical protein n=1 Tax=Streptomyces sp. NPDC056749 TaxID=3345936 RepID=UPI0036BBB380